MGALQNLMKEVDALRDQLETLKPLKAADEERLWKKFRLEWNYNSNHIEGNTLTYGQTELLLIFDKTTGDHEMREYEEMKAHDVALKMVVNYAKDNSRELTEADIREFNKSILVQPFWGNAQTPDGQPTRKLIQPGEYKKEPNSVRLQNGEMFHYASPEETPAKMNELVDWLRNTSAEKKLHPLQIAAQLHYDFVRIHPFDDCNGRTSRLLMNYVLMRNGYPPVIIKSADKKNYLNALNKADVGDLDSFIQYIGEQLSWSLRLNIKAAKGDDIEEDDDLYKEIDVWKNQLDNLKDEPIKSTLEIKKLYDDSLRFLIENYYMRQKDAFDNIFEFNDVSFEVDNNYRIDTYPTSVDFEKLFLEYQNNILTIFDLGSNDWKITYSRDILKDSKARDFSVNSMLRFKFLPVRFEIYHNEISHSEIYHYETLLISKPYSYRMSNDEMQDLVKKCVKGIFDLIRSKFEGQSDPKRQG